MTEPITTATAAEQPAPVNEMSRGAKIDELVTRIPARTMRLERVEAEAEQIRKARTVDAVELVGLVGNRQAAATLLGMTGRELAGLLPRGAK